MGANRQSGHPGTILEAQHLGGRQTCYPVVRSLIKGVCVFKGAVMNHATEGTSFYLALCAAFAGSSSQVRPSIESIESGRGSYRLGYCRLLGWMWLLDELAGLGRAAAQVRILLCACSGLSNDPSWPQIRPACLKRQLAY